MANIKILVWKTSEPVAGAEPDVEVKIPGALARWVPRMMAFVPRKTKEEVWGAGADFDSMFVDLEKMANEVADTGIKEVMDVKTKDSRVRFFVERG